MPRNQKRNLVYGMGDNLLELPPIPIISQRAPNTRDKREIGSIWIDQPNDDIYILTSIVANAASWIGAGGGAGSFTNITASGNITAGGTITSTGAITAGDSLTMSSGTCTITADDDVAQAIYLHTDAGTTETIEIYADQGTDPASIYVHSDDGGVTVESAFASADAINILASDAAGGIDMDWGTGGFSAVGVNGAFTLETGTGTISLGADTAAKNIILGNATGATDLLLQAGTAGITLSAAGIVDMVPATDSQAATTVTINANVGSGTFTGDTTAAGGSVTLTVTNSVCTVASSVFCSVSTLGTNDAQLTIQRVEPKAGSFEVTCKNNGAAAVNGDIILTFWIIAA